MHASRQGVQSPTRRRRRRRRPSQQRAASNLCMAGPAPLDPRLELFRERVETSLKPKDAKAFDKMFDVEASKVRYG